MNDLTVILNAAAHGDGHSASALLPLVYDELRRLARSRMAMEGAGHTLQPTALVHEAWLRMVAAEDRTWQNRAYFFSSAATAMRRILVEHARKKSRLKRGGERQRLDIDALELSEPVQDEGILMVEEALQQLEQAHPKRGRVVMLKYFGGMTNKEVAETMGIGEATVERYWAFSKAWLYDRISSQK
jgi:RNA polymerase sigma factor (TIGR02999 family)